MGYYEWGTKPKLFTPYLSNRTVVITTPPHNMRTQQLEQGLRVSSSTSTTPYINSICANPDSTRSFWALPRETNVLQKQGYDAKHGTFTLFKVPTWATLGTLETLNPNPKPCMLINFLTKHPAHSSFSTPRSIAPSTSALHS